MPIEVADASSYKSVARPKVTVNGYYYLYIIRMEWEGAEKAEVGRWKLEEEENVERWSINVGRLRETETLKNKAGAGRVKDGTLW